jgi:hypothetical protein
VKQNDEWIGVSEAARIAGVSIQRIHELGYAGRLGQQIAGRHWVFTRKEIEAYKNAPKQKGGRPRKRPQINLAKT